MMATSIYSVPALSYALYRWTSFHPLQPHEVRAIVTHHVGDEGPETPKSFLIASVTLWPRQNSTPTMKTIICALTTKLNDGYLPQLPELINQFSIIWPYPFFPFLLQHTPSS